MTEVIIQGNRGKYFKITSLGEIASAFLCDSVNADLFSSFIDKTGSFKNVYYNRESGNCRENQCYILPCLLVFRCCLFRICLHYKYIILPEIKIWGRKDLWVGEVQVGISAFTLVFPDQQDIVFPAKHTDIASHPQGFQHTGFFGGYRKYTRLGYFAQYNYFKIVIPDNAIGVGEHA